MRRTAVGFVAATAVLAAFLLAADPASVWRATAVADPLVVAVGLPSVLVALGCWSEAYRRLFAAAGATDLSRGPAFAAYGAGAFTKQIVPLGHLGGPAIVAYAYDRVFAMGYDRSFAVVTVGEAIALAGSVALAIVGAAGVAAAASALDYRLLAASVLLAASALLAVVAVVLYRRRWVGRAVHGLARLLGATVGRVSGRVHRVSDAASVDAALDRYYRTLDVLAGDRRALGAAVGFTLVGWVCFSLPLYATARAVGVDLPLFLAFFLVPASGLTAAFPLPGGLGGYEIALTGSLVVLVGADPGAAAAAVLLYRLWSYWLLLLVGGVATAFAATTDRRGEGDPISGRE